MKNVFFNFINWLNKPSKFMKGLCIFNVIGFILLTLLYALFGHYWIAFVTFILLLSSILTLIEEFNKPKKTETKTGK